MRSSLFRTHRSPLCALAVSILALVTGACATGSRTTATAAPRVVMGSSSSATRLAAADIAQQDATTLYDVLMRLRPEFLQPRYPSPTAPQGVLPLVYLDEQLLGDVAELRKIPRELARDVRLLSAFDARARFGRRHAGGVIAVSTR